MSDPAAAYAYVWEFIVTDETRAAFERAYGPAGDWARLFARGDGYLGTTLIRDHADANRFLTIDRWRSKGDNEAFLAEFGAEFAAADEKCEALTVRETKIGDFEIVR